MTRGRLILETVVDMVGVARPAMAFYPGRELNNDPTNWWGPNPPAVRGMLRSVGFDDVRTITGSPSPLYRAARAVSHRLRGQEHARACVPAGSCSLSRAKNSSCTLRSRGREVESMTRRKRLAPVGTPASRIRYRAFCYRRSADSLDRDAIAAFVVRHVIVVDAEEQLAARGHVDGRPVADAERCAIADSADQRPGRYVGQRGICAPSCPSANP